jgi:hypothetical protein
MLVRGSKGVDWPSGTSGKYQEGWCSNELIECLSED